MGRENSAERWLRVGRVSAKSPTFAETLPTPTRALCRIFSPHQVYGRVAHISHSPRIPRSQGAPFLAFFARSGAFDLQPTISPRLAPRSSVTPMTSQLGHTVFSCMGLFAETLPTPTSAPSNFLLPPGLRRSLLLGAHRAPHPHFLAAASLRNIVPPALFPWAIEKAPRFPVMLKHWFHQPPRVRTVDS